jgi:hypothetical protein
MPGEVSGLILDLVFLPPLLFVSASLEGLSRLFRRYIFRSYG